MRLCRMSKHSYRLEQVAAYFLDPDSHQTFNPLTLRNAWNNLYYIKCPVCHFMAAGASLLQSEYTISGIRISADRFFATFWHQDLTESLAAIRMSNWGQFLLCAQNLGSLVF